MNKNIFIILLSLSIILSFAIFTFNFNFYFYNNNIYVYAQTLKQTQQQQQGKQHLGAENITLYDPNLKIELVTSGLDFPTTMEFLGQNDFLILEKNTGNVKRVINGTLLEKPLLHVNTSIKDERGLLGIAVSKKKNFFDNPFFIENKNLTHTVFLSYVECKDIQKNTECENRVYRYDLDNKNNLLVNPMLLLKVPSFPDPSHIGGIIKIGPDENLYVTVGNFQNTIPTEIYKTPTQNFEDSHPIDGRAGILRMTQDGYPVFYPNNGSGIIGDKYPLDAYYAYGIRNSFGIDFDPITGKLWDSENGPQFGDEVNLVEPGFNSGSDRVYGFWEDNDLGDMLKNKNGEPIVVGNNPENLVDFGGKGHYSPPEFTWIKTIAPTALSFLDSDRLGSQYKNDMFVGSADGGYLFHFKPNANRNGLVLEGNLTDKIAYNRTEFDDILLGEGFSIITDVKQGPDGYLYVVSGLKQSKSEKFGAVFRIAPIGTNINNTSLHS